MSICRDYYWYNNYIQYKMPKYTWHREFSILGAKGLTEFKGVRNKRMHSPQHFQFLMTNMRLFLNGIEFNCYYSLAEYDNGLPMMENKENETDLKKVWNDEHYKHMVGYDFMLDIDADGHDQADLDKARRQAYKLFRRLYMYKIQFNMYFSGCGFHFIIPYKMLPGPFSFDPGNVKGNTYELYSFLAKSLKKGLKLSLLDTSIYDSRRLCKVPFSLAIYENIYPKCLIKLPICEKQLKVKFNLDEFTLGKVNYKEILDVLYNSEFPKVHFSDFLACFYSGYDEVSENVKKESKIA